MSSSQKQISYTMYYPSMKIFKYKYLKCQLISKDKCLSFICLPVLKLQCSCRNSYLHVINRGATVASPKLKEVSGYTQFIELAANNPNISHALWNFNYLVSLSPTLFLGWVGKLQPRKDKRIIVIKAQDLKGMRKRQIKRNGGR